MDANVKHRLPRKHFQRDTASDELVLESCVEVIKEKVTSRRVEYHGVRFLLDKDALLKIEQAKATRQKLEISDNLLSDFRYYVFFSPQAHLQSGFTFLTYYSEPNSSEILIRSVISLDGEVIQQVRGDCLKDPQFALKITSAHYWLIDQLLGQLRRRKSLLWVEIVAAILSVIIVFLSVLLNLDTFFALHPLIRYFGALLMALFLQLGLKYLILFLLPTFSMILLRQLFFGRFSHRERNRKMALKILARIGF
ncbi:MAG: hypothetical protein ACOC0N_02620 [Chroococcales cyanobacterium]